MIKKYVFQVLETTMRRNREHEWKVPVLQELLNTRMNNFYVEGFDDNVITEMINMLYSE